MIQKYYGYFAMGVVALFLLAPTIRSQSVSSGGVFQPIQDIVYGGTATYVGQLSPIIIAGTADDTFETTLTFAQPTASHVISVFAATDTLVGRATTDTFTNKTLTAPTITNPNVTTELMTASGATETLTSADCGQTVFMDDAAGSQITLPAATGSGCWFRFIVTVAITSSTNDIIVVGNDEFIGGVTIVTEVVGQTDTFSVAITADNDTIQMDGNTEGGELGSMLFVQDAAADDWFVNGQLIGIGSTPTTPFLTGQVS